MITIAVCTRNRPSHLNAWVAHMSHVIDSTQHAILIIDQSDEPMHRLWPTHITYTHTHRHGLSHARNQAIQQCTTPYILFTDDDCRPAHDWLIRAHDCIATDPIVAIWFGQAWPSGTEYTLNHYPTYAGHTTWAIRSDGAVCHALRTDTQPFRTNQPVAVLEHLGHGNQMLMNCEILRHIGGFHPWLGAGAWLCSGEDVELTLRLLTHGHTCAYTPQLRIIHDAWVSPTAHAQLSQRYTTGMIALHVAHAWCGNSVARAYLRFRLNEAIHAFSRLSRPSIRSTPVPRWRRLIAIVHGIVGGISLIIWRR